MTNLVQFPGLGLSFELDRVAFSIGGMNIYWYGVCIAVGMCLALVFAFRHSVEFGVDADAMVDVILIGVVMGILCARLYYVALSPYQYHSLKDVLAIRDGGLAIYGGIIGAFLFGGLACKWRKVPVLPMFDLAAMVSYYHDRYDLEADIVLHLEDGRYALIECKLGSREIDDGAKHLLELKRLIQEHNKTEKQMPIREPDLLIVMTGGSMAYTRQDGVKVIPLACLKD